MSLQVKCHLLLHFLSKEVFIKQAGETTCFSGCSLIYKRPVCSKSDRIVSRAAESPVLLKCCMPTADSWQISFLFHLLSTLICSRKHSMAGRIGQRCIPTRLCSLKHLHHNLHSAAQHNSQLCWFSIRDLRFQWSTLGFQRILSDDSS